MRHNQPRIMKNNQLLRPRSQRNQIVKVQTKMSLLKNNPRRRRKKLHRKQLKIMKRLRKISITKLIVAKTLMKNNSRLGIKIMSTKLRNTEQ